MRRKRYTRETCRTAAERVGWIVGMRLVVAVNVTALFVAACAASSGSDAEPADDGASSSLAPPTTPVVAHEARGRARTAPAAWTHETTVAVCTTLPLTSPNVPAFLVPADAPSPTGGAIAPGVYDLTEDILYTGADGPQRRVPQAFAQTVRFGLGGLIDVATREGDVATFATGKWKTSGTKLLSMEECPEAGHFGAPSYTATDGEVRVFYGDEVLVYTMR